ncbi:MAG: hypothetical protein ABIY55_20405 [Kofleriaceae bacterium]
MMYRDADGLYFVDGRNAVVARDNRVIRPGSIVPSRVTPGLSSRVTYSPPPAAVFPAQVFPGYGQYPQQFAPASFFGTPSPVYSPGPGPFMGMGGFGGLFGGLNLGDVVKLAADAFAAFKSLPAAPVPTGDVATDVANSDVHMTALARDAQTRKQIEFAGEVAGRFAGRGSSGGW